MWCFFHCQEKQYAQDHEFIAKAINDCPTSSLATPEDKEEAQQVPVSSHLILCLT